MPSSELSIPNLLSDTPQRVQDEANVGSSLLLAKNQVQVIPPTDAPAGASFFLQAPPLTGTSPSVVLHSLSTESAIRFTANDGQAFHIGIGGNAGPGTFFFFSGQAGAGVIVKIEQDGDVRIEKNLSVGGQLAVDGAQFRLQNLPTATTVLKHVMIDPASGKLFVQ
ncbi:MAG TPA: hypothetical protein VFP80_10760 [Thermoanaerobaculia bacterium]|nr:hypothetical protein [Thermoanaerobaculia bacterium]